jgi:hypothetical protein
MRLQTLPFSALYRIASYLTEEDRLQWALTNHFFYSVYQRCHFTFRWDMEPVHWQQETSLCHVYLYTVADRYRKALWYCLQQFPASERSFFWSNNQTSCRSFWLYVVSQSPAELQVANFVWTESLARQTLQVLDPADYALAFSVFPAWLCRELRSW